MGGNTQILRDERAPEEIKNMMWVIDAVKHVPDIVGVFIILLIPYLLWAFWPPLTAWFKSLNRKAQTNKAERRERNRQKESPQTSRLQEAKSSPSLENLTQTDFRLWEEIAQSKDQAITIKQLPPLSKAMKALRDAQRLDVPCRFHELTDSEDAVIIDGRQLKYTPVVVDQSLARLCDAGVLKRCEWQGGTRVYPLLVPYDAHAEPSV